VSELFEMSTVENVRYLNCHSRLAQKFVIEEPIRTYIYTKE